MNSQLLLLRRVSIDGHELSFRQGNLSWRVEGFMSSWDGVLVGVGSSLVGLSEGEKLLVGETFDGRRVEGQVNVTARELLARTVEFQGTGELSVNGEPMRAG